MTRLPETLRNPASRRRLWRVVWSRDLQIAIAAGVVFGILPVLLPNMKPLGAHLWGVATTSIVVALGAWQMKHALIGLLKSDYGELVRATPSGVEGALLPFDVVIVVAFVTTCWCTLLGVFIEGLPSAVQAIVVGVTAFLLVWSMLGAIELWRILRQHEIWDSEVKAQREKLERLERRQHTN